ncbi:PAS domain-containing methyl-accepting chemotaxis protein [Gallaecimonas xiamenensis]|uniref:Methyl-accepting chemotaxis sensory transducer n=1 Tax=Gallaecimonas xiamenensis 3-C-1 TaxID=745411 RepID=K2K4J9_9GAMM|nr:PAS domain-containing methyl-accepting chemotaxis protein [Gallaecimonas xiamenensis]EKE77864.1 methyl-accepting chemotaxis sensory transducer [Gallaecimonas xiamenensis 3-C-1]
MRQNLPVTGKERTFSPNTKLISTTDLSSHISHCNDAFVAVSGYSRDELIGQPHNLVRHPDMPSAVFKVMWEHLKAGKPWMGLVKNRCKNGDHYWVNAYVTPITEQGRLVGYESVRSCPSREQVARAEALYRRIRDGRPPSAWHLEPQLLGLGLGLALSGGLYATGWPGASELALLATLAGYGLWSRLQRNAIFRELSALLPAAFSHKVAVLSYTANDPLLGNLKVKILSTQAHLDTVLTRIRDAATEVARQSVLGLNQSEQSAEQMQRQQRETEQVAAAMHQMTTTIGEVSSHVQATAGKAEEANRLAEQGRRVAGTTRSAIGKLKVSVDDIGQAVTALSAQSNSIASAAQMIEQIADQTNLLALNAAIEAARAGEQGRGFAVVADEVRQLARRTQESTQQIHQIISELTLKARQAVASAETGCTDAEQGLEQVEEAESMLLGISEAVGSIADMSMQMATAVEEQAHVAEEVNRQVVTIASLADTSLTEAKASAGTVRHLRDVSDRLEELVVRFSR